MKKSTLLAVATLTALSLSPLLAQDPPVPPKDGEHPKRGEIFDKIDEDNNGSISEEEFLAEHARRAEEHFKKLDRDGNGELTKEEFPPARRGPHRPGQHQCPAKGDQKPGQEQE